MSKLRDLVEGDGDSTGEESDLVALVEEAKRLIAEEEETLMLEKRTQRINIKDESVEVLVAKLDHMRDANQYMKTLAKWCADLHLVMLLVVAKDTGVVVVVEGEEGALGSLITRSQSSIKRLSTYAFVTRWKTVNIDVDRKGRPCKERLLQALTRQRLDRRGALTEVIQKDALAANAEDLVGEPTCFTFKKADRLMDCFSQTGIEDLLHNLFSS